MARGRCRFQDPLVGRSSYRGGGRRGDRPSRGGGQGNFGNHASNTGGSGPPFRGRGRGRGRSGPRRFPQHGASSSSHLEPNSAEEEEEKVEMPPDNHEEGAQALVPSQASTSAPGKAAPSSQPAVVAHCELCKADCNSFEILEQHKNGKRHKKNLQRAAQLNTANKPAAEMQNQQKSVSGSDPEANLPPKDVEEGEENKQNLPENLPTEAVTNENKMGTGQQNNLAEQPEIPKEEQSTVQARKPWINRFDSQRHGIKRKMRGGHGGKHVKAFNAPRRPIEPPKPKVVIPLICDLCNVKCDTREVLDRHLSGKKHIAKLKRFEGHQAMYGPMGLQALYPPNPITQKLLHPQGHQQAFYGPQGSYPPPQAYVPPQTYHAAPEMTSTGPGYQVHPPQVSDAIPNFSGQEAVHQAQEQSASVEPEA
ncbi:unnamed protein product [Ilex paraguariensis]|uniref:Uncharacterized protein n=1 Tax=Ilex paraguariensis TaxID=185542 RepID=A0ABC8ULT4_9AQUA